MADEDDKFDALNYSLLYDAKTFRRHTYATYVEKSDDPIATTTASAAAAAAISAMLKGMTIESDDMARFYKSIMVEKPQPQKKTWTRVYVGFESLNDTVEDLTEDAFASVLPSGEFKGTVKITVEYTPDLTSECQHGFEFWWTHCPHCSTTSPSET